MIRLKRLVRGVLSMIVLQWTIWGICGCGERQVLLIREMAHDTLSDIAGDDSGTTPDSETVAETETSVATETATETETAFDTNTEIETAVETETEPVQNCQFDANRIQVTEVDVGQTVLANEEDAALMPIAISPVPEGGSRLAWMGADGAVHITTLNDADEIVENSQAFSAVDFQDVHATSDGGVLLLTRDAAGGGTLNCGAESNLCYIPESPIPCYDMYMVRFDESGERWATRLTSASEFLPPYSTGPGGPPVTMIWWYAHHGRIASNGSSFAAYFGSALSSSNGSCIDIYQGDRMQVVDETGELMDGGFGWGTGPSGYQHVIWNSAAHAYVSVCKTQSGSSGIAAFAPDMFGIWSVDPIYANFSELVLADNGGYWLALSNRKMNQPEQAEGLAEIHLLQFTSDEIKVHEIISLTANANVRSPHIAPFENDTLLLLYETATTPGEMVQADERTTLIEQRSRVNGVRQGMPIAVDSFTGHRYHAMRAFPNGSVAMVNRGDGPDTIKILRVLPCDAH
jgi:hypothetical protein